MLPVDAYPGPLPLTNAQVRALFADDLAARALRSTYVAFVMIPVEERIGEWRFAGVAPDLAAAFETIGQFGMSVADDPSDKAWRDFVELGLENFDWHADLEDACLYDETRLGAELPSSRVVLYGEGGAPYDDCGFCIVEAASIAGTRYEGLAPETQRAPMYEDD